IRDDDVRRISCDGLSGEPSRSGRPAAGRAGYVYGLDESVVAGGARSARKTLHGCMLPDGLRRADQSAWLAGARDLLLRTGAAKLTHCRIRVVGHSWRVRKSEGSG